jgi:hypothetical protein
VFSRSRVGRRGEINARKDSRMFGAKSNAAGRSPRIFSVRVAERSEWSSTTTPIRLDHSVLQCPPPLRALQDLQPAEQGRRVTENDNQINGCAQSAGQHASNHGSRFFNTSPKCVKYPTCCISETLAGTSRSANSHSRRAELSDPIGRSIRSTSNSSSWSVRPPRLPVRLI